ncbi:MAG: PHP domain-containing protein [Lachnospiraceae bacterium]|nr:PHP domain-containing protein [Lachnospiraceae bacterium]
MIISDIHKIDLHMHTTVSDGTDTPEEILGRIRDLGMDLFSVTDHDAIRASLEIPELRKEDDPHFLSGVEFSCQDEGGKYHILGYGYDPSSEAIRKVVQMGHDIRLAKLKDRLDFLQETFGFDFPEEELRKLFAMENPGKPHIGNMMVRLGYVATKEDAIHDYINKKKGPSRHVRPEDAIEGILKSGGIPVLAHPTYGSGEELILGDDMEERLRHLLPFGLQGVEAYYSGFTDKIIAEMRAFAEKFDLYVTAGSDYHGRNKLVSLGDTNLEDAAQGPAGMKIFFEAVADRIC